MSLLVLILTTPYFSFNSKAAEIPTDNAVLKEQGKADQPEIPSLFKLLVWNIQKAESGKKWQSDFRHLAINNDIILLQEGYQNNTYNNTINTFSQMLWLFATSFIYQGFETGVAIGTKIRPIQTQWLRSPGREPLLNSPKMSILSHFNIKNSHQKLLIANIHGINFVGNNTFEEQINQVLEVLEKHQGPIVFAGDFNTWNSSRFTFLKTKTQSIGLKEIDFKEDPRYLKLDYVFYRQLIPEESKILSSIDSSDHYPITINFNSKDKN